MTDLNAFHDRAERVQQYIERDPCQQDGFLPLSVREFFDTNIPAIVNEVAALRARLAELGWEER